MTYLYSNHTPDTLLRDLRAIGWTKQKTELGTRLAIKQLLKSEKTRLKVGLPVRHPVHEAFLDALGLPTDLLTLIETDTLEREVQKAYEWIDAVNARLDAWEAAHPVEATKLPWAESRMAWKAKGSPRLEWWEALRLTSAQRAMGRNQRCTP